MPEKDRGKNFKKLKNKTIATKETWRKQRQSKEHKKIDFRKSRYYI